MKAPSPLAVVCVFVSIACSSVESKSATEPKGKVDAGASVSNSDSGRRYFSIAQNQSASTSNALEITGKNKRVLFYSNDLIQQADFEVGEKGLTFTSAERLPQETLPTPTVVAHFSTAYKIQGVIHSGQADLFYVIGIGRGGTLFVERWEITPPEGALFANLNLSSQPVGVAILGSQLSTGIVGGTWVDPTNRPINASAERTELYRGTDFALIVSSVADPEGRFLLLLIANSPTDRRLYRIDVGDTLAIPVEILTAAEFPGIVEAEHLFLWELATGVRTVMIEALSFDPSQRALLLDPENDGIFEQPIIFTYEQWVTGGLDEKSFWGADFQSYF